MISVSVSADDQYIPATISGSEKESSPEHRSASNILAQDAKQLVINNNHGNTRKLHFVK